MSNTNYFTGFSFLWSRTYGIVHSLHRPVFMAAVVLIECILFLCVLCGFVGVIFREYSDFIRKF
jgi:hypothetical protein